MYFMSYVWVYAHTCIKIFHRKGITFPLPPIREHIVSGCISFSDIKIDQCVEHEMDDI